jgi:hypothetical protein
MRLLVLMIVAIAQENAAERLRVPSWFAMFDPIDREIEKRTENKIDLSYSSSLGFGPLVGRYEGLLRIEEARGLSSYKEAGTKEGTVFAVLSAEAFCEISVGLQQQPRVSLACESADVPEKSLSHLLFLETLPKPPPPPPPGTHRVEYVIDGDCGWAGLTLQNAGGGTEQHEVKLPAKYTIIARPGTFLYISAQKKSEAGSVHVEIRVDGVTVRRSNASAPYGIAAASGRL